MQELELTCSCGAVLSAPERWGGRRVLCPTCGAENRVPLPDPPPSRPRRRAGWLRRRRRYAREVAPTRLGSPPVPAGLRVAATAEDLAARAARRRRRRVRLAVVLGLVAVVVAGVFAARAAWQNYRRKLYRGVEVEQVTGRPYQDAGRKALHKIWHLRRKAHGWRATPAKIERYLDEAGALLEDLEERADLAEAKAYLRNDMAWLLLTTHFSSYRDPERALALAERAVEGKSGNEAAFLDTYAEALFQVGRYDEAVQAARRATAQIPDWPAIMELAERAEEGGRPLPDWAEIHETASRIEAAVLGWPGPPDG